MDIIDLIPKHKDDLSVIDGLKKLSFDEIEPIIPGLLEWLQDINWPIANPVANILEPFADKLTPEILKILQTNDGLWKLWVLIRLARKTTDPILLKEIERIATQPTRDEITEEVNLEAIDILKGEYR